MIDDYIKEFTLGWSPEGQLKGLIKHIQELMTEKPELFNMLFDLTSMALWSKTFKKLLMHLMEEVTALMKECLPESSVTEKYSKDVVARVLTGAMFGIALQNSLNHDPEIVQALDIIPELL